MLSIMPRPRKGRRTQKPEVVPAGHERAFPHLPGRSPEGEVRNCLLAGSIPIPGQLANSNAGVIIQPSSYRQFHPKRQGMMLASD